MGISDDIVPIRQQRIHHGNSRKDARKVSDTSPKGKDEDKPADQSNHLNVSVLEKNEDEAQADEKTAKAELRDSFFDSHHKPTARSKDGEDDDCEPNRPRRNLAGVAFIVITATLVGVLVYQNFAEIKGFLVDDKSATTKSSTSTSSPSASSSEIQAQDYTSGASTATTTPTEDGSTATNAAPAATAPTTLDKTAVTIQVLNGSGISGAADAAKKILVADGFSVKSVTNARSFSYATSKIYYKTGQETIAEAAKTALSAYQITLENSDTIAKTYDIVVVIGKK